MVGVTAPSCPCPQLLPQVKILMAIKCHLVIIPMPRCASFFKATQISVIFCVSMYYKTSKFVASIACPKAKSVSASAPDLPSRGSASVPR